MIRKQKLLEIKNVYTANAFVAGSRTFVGGGSETEPIVQLYDMASGDLESLNHCPGGMMSLIPVPGQADSLVSVMGLFPPSLGRRRVFSCTGKKLIPGRLPGRWICLLHIDASSFPLRKGIY